MSGALLHEVTLAEGGLYQTDNLLPLQRVIPDVPPKLFHNSRQTAQATSSSSGNGSSTGKGVNTTVMLLPKGGGGSPVDPDTL